MFDLFTALTMIGVGLALSWVAREYWPAFRKTYLFKHRYLVLEHRIRYIEGFYEIVAAKSYDSDWTDGFLEAFKFFSAVMRGKQFSIKIPPDKILEKLPGLLEAPGGTTKTRLTIVFYPEHHDLPVEDE